jgi:hemerythrin-like metal-binding protein
MELPDNPCNPNGIEVIHSLGRAMNLTIPMIGVTDVDHDHLEIMRLIKTAVDADDKNQFFDFIVHVLDYIHRHLASEEAFMERVQYPGRRIHAVEHASLRNFIKVYLKPSTKDMDNKQEIINECVKAFRFHIIQHDIPLANYINAQAIEFKDGENG